MSTENKTPGLDDLRLECVGKTNDQIKILLWERLNKLELETQSLTARIKELETEVEGLHDVKQSNGFLASDNLRLLGERDQLHSQNLALQLAVEKSKEALLLGIEYRKQQASDDPPLHPISIVKLIQLEKEALSLTTPSTLDKDVGA